MTTPGVFGLLKGKRSPEDIPELESLFILFCTNSSNFAP